jgi:hypothetical protein
MQEHRDEYFRHFEFADVTYEYTKRIAGLNKGKIWMNDDFDQPLPDSFRMGKMKFLLDMHTVINSSVKKSA